MNLRCTGPLASLLLATCLFEAAGSYGAVSSWHFTLPFDRWPAGASLDNRWIVHPSGLDDRKGIAVFQDGRHALVEQVFEHDLEAFLRTITPDDRTPWRQRGRDRCRTGRFLLNDPRVGLFHNQRLSYEAALEVAKLLGRVLVVPGFFKFPHPEPYDGAQWVPARRLIDWDRFKSCYEDVLEVEELIRECGSDVLNNHVTVQFYVKWMAEGAPWVNGTRPDLRWQAPQGTPTRFHSRRTAPERILTLDDPWSYVLAEFLRPGFGEQQTIRVHGLISAPREDPRSSRLCILPASHLRDEAMAVLAASTQHGPEGSLGLHLRIFKAGSLSKAGEGPEMDKEMGNYCKVAGKDFGLIASFTLARRFHGFWPRYTLVASNEADSRVLWETVSGFPGVRMLSFSHPRQPYEQAVTIDDCEAALQPILIDAMVLSMTDRYIGNTCSSMSHYIYELRHSYFKKPEETSFMIGGRLQGDLLKQVLAVSHSMEEELVAP